METEERITEGANVTEVAEDISSKAEGGTATESKGKKKKDKKDYIIIALVILLLLAIAGGAIYLLTRKPSTEDSKGNIIIDSDATDEETQKAVNELSGRFVEFSGISDETIDQKSKVILENLPSNEGMYMKFVISDTKTGEVVKETDLIPAGKHVEWVPGETMDKGEYTLSFKQIPYWLMEDGEYMELTTGNNIAVFTIV